MKTCRGCGAIINEDSAVQCPKCGRAVPKVSLDVSARTHYHGVVLVLVGSGIAFCSATYVGVKNGSILQTKKGSMRSPNASLGSPVLTIIIVLGLFIFFMIPEWSRSRQAYKKEREQGKRESEVEKIQ